MLHTVKSFLEQGKTVCFSGTPCQIEGLKCYLKKDYENLITVDVVCRAVPSPLIFRKYVEFQEQKLADKIKTVRFRDKYYGYKYSTMNIITDRIPSAMAIGTCVTAKIPINFTSDAKKFWSGNASAS